MTLLASLTPFDVGFIMGLISGFVIGVYARLLYDIAMARIDIRRRRPPHRPPGRWER